MDKKVKVALIGCGSISQRGILPHLALEDARQVIELVAVCDIVEERARETAAQFNVPEWYLSTQEVLANADVDALLIATPIPYHYENAMAAIGADKHVYLQKTIATSVAEAGDLITAAHEGSVKLVVSPGQMLSPGYQQIKKTIDKEGIGQVYWAFASTAAAGHEYEPFRVDDPVDPTWYYKPGGGPVLDMAAYALHTLTGIFGPVKQVAAMSGIGLPMRQWQGGKIRVEMDDNTLLLLDFDGRFAFVGGHFCQTGKVVGWGFLGIYGSLGTIEVTGLDGGTAYPAEIELNGSVTAAGGSLTDRSKLGSVPFLTSAHAALPEAHVWVDIRHLVECILHDQEPVPTGEHARHVLEIIEKGYEAARSGRTLELNTSFGLFVMEELT